MDGVSLLVTVFDMSNLQGAHAADTKDGNVGKPAEDADPRSRAALTKLRLLFYDPKNNATASLIVDAKTLLGALRQLAGIEHRGDALLNMITTPHGEACATWRPLRIAGSSCVVVHRRASSSSSSSSWSVMEWM